MTQPEPPQQEPTQPEPPQPEPTLPEPTQQEPTLPEPTQSLPPIRSPPRSSTEVKVKVEVDEAQTEQPPPPPPSPTIDIAPDGDLVLVVGPEAARFRVYSQVLKISSKYFTRLLSPPLPDEVLMRHLDADAINVIMEVLHHRRDIVSGGLDAKRILRSAIAAYEIDCKEAMSFSLYQSLMTTLDYKTLNSPQAFMLLETMYWLGYQEGYSGLSSQLIINHQGPYLDLWPFKSEYIKPDVAVQILRALEDQRDKIRRHLVRMALNNPYIPNFHRLPTCSKECAWIQSSREKWKSLVLGSKVIERIVEDSVQGALNIARTIMEPAIAPHPHCKGPRPHQLPNGERFNQMDPHILKKQGFCAGLVIPRRDDGVST